MTDDIQVIDGSSQETFDQSFGGLLAELLKPDPRDSTWKHVKCLRCKHVQNRGGFYLCENCGWSTGDLIP